MNGKDIKADTHSVNETMDNVDSEKKHRNKWAWGCKKSPKYNNLC